MGQFMVSARNVGDNFYDARYRVPRIIYLNREIEERGRRRKSEGEGERARRFCNTNNLEPP